MDAEKTEEKRLVRTGRLVIDCYRTTGPGDYLFERGIIKSIIALYRKVTDRRGGELLKELEEGGTEGQSGAVFKWHFEPNNELEANQ